MTRTGLFRFYYLFTPAFLLLELFANLNLRITIPWGGDYLVYFYLAICFVVGGFLLKNPLHINLFTLLESSVNIMLLVVSFYLTLFNLPDLVDSGRQFHFGIADVIHFVIAGSILLAGFYSNPLMRRRA